MGLYQDIQPYLESEYKMATPSTGGGSCDNLILYHYTYYTLLTDFSELAKVKIEMIQYNDLCYYLPGIYTRHPNQLDNQNSVDNYIAIALSSASASADILEHNKKFYIYDTNSKDGKTGIDSWFGRFIGFSSLLKYLNHKENFLDNIALCAAMLFTLRTPKEDTSNKCLQLLINRYLKHTGPGILIGLALKIWDSYMLKQYPNGVAEMYSIYFGKDHPFTLYAPKDWNY